MYEPLEACAADFCEFKKTLTEPGNADRLDVIRAALDATAENISATVGATDVERDNLAKLYRGMLAASRIVSELQEKQAAK